MNHSGQWRDLLCAAILLHQKALDLQAALHSERSNSLSNLGLMLMAQFDKSGQCGDLDEVILLHRQALELGDVHSLGLALDIRSLSLGLKHRL